MTYNGHPSADFDLVGWIAAHLPDADGPKPWQGTGQIWSLPTCPYDASHGGGCAFVGRHPEGGIFAGCHHNSCRHWGWHELRELLEPKVRRRGLKSAGSAIPADISTTPVLLCMTDVLPRPVRWLWANRIARGKITVIAGDPGLGKSFITLDLAARVSNGMPWPDMPTEAQEAGGIVMLSAEDDPGDTIRPRLDAARANVSRIVLLQAVRRTDPETGAQLSDPFCLTSDLQALEEAIQRVENCRLVIVDPISAYLGRTDSHKNSEVRCMLAHLKDLAEKYGVAVVLVNHLRKGEGSAMHRSMGSIAFVAAARAAWIVARDPDDPAGRRRYFLPVKNNIGNDHTGLSYELLDAGGGTPHVAWGPAVEVSADEVLGGADKTNPAAEQAVEWLRDRLANGPIASKQLEEDANRDGIKGRTLWRAKKVLKISARRAGFGPGGQWVWDLPGPDTQAVTV
jgi:hypothetical protein